MPPRRRHRPSVPLVLYAHPFELAVAVVLGTSAIRTAIRLDDTLAVLPPLIAYAWAAFTALGILGVIVGVIGSTDVTGRRPGLRAFYRALEKAGLYLTAAATAVIGVLIANTLPLAESWAPDAQLTAIAAACILRALAIRKAERITLDVLRATTTAADSADVVDDVLGAPHRKGGRA